MAVVSSFFVVGVYLTTSAPFRARAPGPVSGRLSTTANWRGWPGSRGFPLRFRRRHWLFGHPVPAEELGVPYGRLTSAPADGLDLDGVSVFRTHELRSGWVPSLLRGRRCSSWPESLTDQRLRPLNRWSLHPATASHRCGVPLDGASTEGSSTSPVRSSPRLTLPDGIGAPWALRRASHPAVTSNARRRGDRSSSTDLDQRAMSST